MMPSRLKILDHGSYFFDQGIRFACRQCGACCVGEPGTIYVFPSEIETMADFMHQSVADFTAEFLYPFKDSYSIKEDDQGRCRFFNDGCTLYPIRPLQCRTFPFWFANMRSEQRWQRIARQCPGIGTGRLYTRAQIIEIILKTLPF